MRISDQVSAAIAGSTLITALVVMQVPAAKAMTGSEVNDVAREVTVLIRGKQQQFQTQNFMALKVLHREDFTILNNLSDRWNGVKSFRVWNCWASSLRREERSRNEGISQVWIFAIAFCSRPHFFAQRSPCIRRVFSGAGWWDVSDDRWGRSQPRTSALEITYATPAVSREQTSSRRSTFSTRAIP